MTDAERRLWSHLRASQLCGVKFTRQFPISNHVADFACRSLRIAIECDGSQHSDSATDEARTHLIEAHGYRVIRFWNNDILANIDGVQEMTLEQLRNPLPPSPGRAGPLPLPRAGEGLEQAGEGL